jgi:hypothetical protein
VRYEDIENGSLEDYCIKPVEEGQNIEDKQHPNQYRDGLGDLLEDGVSPPPFFSAQLGHNIQDCNEQK